MTLPVVRPPARSLGELLEQTVTAHATRTAHLFLPNRTEAGKPFTFSDWWQQSGTLAATLAPLVAPGDAVVIASPTCPEFLPALLACFRLGAAAVPLYPPRPGQEAEGVAWIQRVATLSGARVVLATPSVAGTLRHLGIGTGESSLPVIELQTAAAMGGSTGAFAGREVSPETTALILFTSGSTGAPKGVVLTHGNLLTNIGEFAAGQGLGPEDRMVTWLPNCHIAGLYTRLVGLFSGAATVEFPAALFLEQPAFWLDTISRYGGRLSAAPNFAYDLLGTIPDAALESLTLQQWKLAISGGEIVRPATFRRLVERLAWRGFSARAFTPYYGLTETLCTTLRQSERLPLLRVDRDALGRHEVRVLPEASEDAVELVSNGRPLGSVQVCIADPATRRPLQAGAVGEVWGGGAGVTPGYLNQEVLNAEVVCAELDAPESGRWFRTGDLGFLHDGELFITGRLKELIIVRGRNLYPADLERGVMGALAAAPVAECAAFSHDTADGEGVAIAVELKRGVELAAAAASDLAARVQSALIQSAGVACAAVTVQPAGSLPRTATAKVQRGRCRQLLQSGAWTPTVAVAGDASTTTAEVPLEPVDPASTLGRLRRVVGGVLHRAADRVDPDRSLAELGLDSLGAVRLLSAMETEFGVRVGIGTLLTAPQLRHLAGTLDRMIARHGAAEVEEPVDYDAELKAVQSLGAELKPGALTETSRAHVFLTGATGFLGSYLLRDLLRVAGTRVTCLVRGDSPATARTRLLQKLAGVPGWNPALNERIEVCCGSLEDPFLGLGEAGLRALAPTLSRIVHNGANVNFVAPYSFLRGVNVTSNLGVLRMAVAGGGLPVHYVSTTAVFNGPDRDRLETIRESDFLASPDSLFSGYAQTKWVSERLWREASTLGLPVTIHRPGLVTGDCETGAWHTDDFLCRFIKGCLQMGRFPDLAVEVDMIPVDVVSTAMARAITGAPGGHALTAYHWTHPAPARMAALAEWFRSAGWPVRVEPVAQWMSSMRSLDDRNALFPLTPFLLQRVGAEGETLFEFFGRRRLNLDRVNAAALMQRSAVQCPDPIADLLPRYAAHLVGAGFLSAPPSPISR